MPKAARPTKATSNTKRMVFFGLIFYLLCAEPAGKAERAASAEPPDLDSVV